jgi:hypothetical protein
MVMRPVTINKISRVEEGPKILGYTGSIVSLEENVSLPFPLPVSGSEQIMFLKDFL